MVPIKNNIQKYREISCIDQQKLADELGVTRTYLSKLENQRFSPGPRLMLRVCSVFHASLSEMFYIDNKEEVNKDCRKQKV